MSLSSKSMVLCSVNLFLDQNKMDNKGSLKWTLKEKHEAWYIMKTNINTVTLKKYKQLCKELKVQIRSKTS